MVTDRSDACQAAGRACSVWWRVGGENGGEAESDHSLTKQANAFLNMVDALMLDVSFDSSLAQCPLIATVLVCCFLHHAFSLLFAPQFFHIVNFVADTAET